MMIRSWSVLGGLGLLMLGVPLAAQSPGNEDRDVLPLARVPFGPGERLTYQVKLGLITVGEAFMGVEGLDTIRGFETYKLVLRLDGSTLFNLMQIHDRYQSWLDTRTLVSRRYVADIHQLNYKRYREFEIYPEERRWEQSNGSDSGETLGSLVLDDISFIYYARSLPLKVGEELSLNRYFKAEHNPVTLKVLRKERIEVPAGTFDTIVIQPIITTDGLFGEGGEAELYLTDDEHRHLIYMNSKIPIIGSLSLLLKDRTFGAPLGGETPEPTPRTGGVR